LAILNDLFSEVIRYPTQWIKLFLDRLTTSEVHVPLLPITAIIVNYNAGPGLVDCVMSIIDDVNEVIVIDNNSIDQSVVLLNSVFPHHDRLKYIFNEENVGFAAACNQGAQAAQNSYWLFFNPDCIASTGSLNVLFNSLLESPITGMVGGLLLNPDGTEQAGGRRLTPTPRRTLIRALGLGRFAQRWPELLVDFNLHQQPLPTAPIAVEAISGACMLVKPEAVAAIGLWDENYFLHCEDLDWCMRFNRAGWKVVFVPNARITHQQGACSSSRPIFVEWHKHKGMTRFYRKFFRRDYSIFLFWLVLMAIWIRFGLVTIRSTFASLIGR
jgi:GT2 family glycosyltransferase